MPSPIDAQQRRLEITNASIRILARGGASALTLKSLAEELGGSITLVTHFVANRQQLFVAITDELIASYEAELASIDDGLGGYDRLRALLLWMAPTTPQDIESEAGRIALISQRAGHDAISHFFDAMEEIMRTMLRIRLVGLVGDDELGSAVAYLRAVVNGLTLSAVEHPGMWPESAVEQAVDRALRGLGLAADEHMLPDGA
ncbi:TetR/AcrR family transcriptional regulator [Actinoplanes sp. NPDC000266]